MAGTFTETNLSLVALNLLPIPPLDGARAWRIFRAFRQRGSARFPQGTWRDHAPDAQRAWFDKLGAQSRRPGRGAQPDLDPEGALSPEAQAAIDRLLRGVTGKARNSRRND
jgi:hypothetical protein